MVRGKTSGEDDAGAVSRAAVEPANAAERHTAGGKRRPPPLDPAKRRRAYQATVRAAIPASAFWLGVALSTVVAHQIGVSRIPGWPAALVVTLGLAAPGALVLATKWSLSGDRVYRGRLLVTLSTTTHTLLLLAFNVLDGFTMLAVAMLLVGWTQNLAYFAEANGLRATLVRTVIQVVLYGTAYTLTTPHELTLDPPTYTFVLVIVLGLGLVMARVAKTNERRTSQIVDLYHVQQQQTRDLAIANERLHQLSMVDGLTGVANRRNFEESLARELGRMRRHREAVTHQTAAQPQMDQLSLILVDVDHFKAYNDACGHLAGDDCLRQVASALKSALLRPADSLARYGGEEFVILLPETAQPGARVVGDRALAAVANLAVPHPASPVGDRVTVSAGLASADFRVEAEALDLVARADQALYRAKTGGRARIVEDARASEPSK